MAVVVEAPRGDRPDRISEAHEPARVQALVAELEPDVDVVVAMLAGTGPGLLDAVQAYGATPDPPLPELRGRIEAVDPAKHASELASRPRLLIRARLDDIISADSFAALRDALGGPEVWAYSTGHESFAYAMPFAIEAALDWVAETCAGREARGRNQEPSKRRTR
jgi:hypothetical protein